MFYQRLNFQKIGLRKNYYKKENQMNFVKIRKFQ